MSATFSELHTRHTDLLQQTRSVRDRKRFVADAQKLLNDLRTAGRSVDLDQRQRLELYADYWGAFIAEITGEYLDTTLDSEVIASTRSAGDDRLTLIYQSGREKIIPFLVPPHAAESPVSRDELLRSLKQRLFTGDLALYGPPGIGKTVLASALAHDHEVLARFPDGVLWTDFSRSGTGGTLNAWAAALEIPERTIAAMSSPEERQRALRVEIGARRMLLIIDDVREDASAVKLGGPGCAHLCTTRSIKAAIAFAPEGLTVVSEMTAGESLALLSRLIPEEAQADRALAAELAASVGGAPLTLALLGKYLEASRDQEGGKSDLRALMARWQREDAQVGDLPLLRDNATLEAATPRSLRLAIGLIDEILDERSRHAFRALSVLPPKPNSFSQDAALVISKASVAALDELAAYGLLESAEPSRYAMYQPISEYARGKLTDESAYHRMVDFFCEYVEAHQRDYAALGLEADNINTALATAFERGRLSDLVRGTIAFYEFLEIRGLHSVARPLLTRAYGAAESLQDTSNQVTILRMEGSLEEKCGDYAKAKQHLDRGLALARQLGDDRKTAELLLTDGIVESNRGNLSQARDCLEQALQLVQEEGELKEVGEICSRLGVITRDQGDFDQAEKYLEEGLRLAREIADSDLESAVLLHLSWVDLMRSGPSSIERAREKLQAGLTLAQGIGNHERIAGIFHGLGFLTRSSEDYAGAELFLREALAHAQEINHFWYIGIIRLEQGELYLQEKKPDQATAALLESLGIASQRDFTFIVALSLYGLGRVAASRGDLGEARRQGQASLAIFGATGHAKAAEVRNWLATLPAVKLPG